MLYRFDAMQVLYFGGRPAYHPSFTFPIPAKASIWFVDDAVTWLGTLASGSSTVNSQSAWLEWPPIPPITGGDARDVCDNRSRLNSSLIGHTAL
jgi:hypothetical protein